MSFRPSHYPCPKTEPHAEHQHNKGPDAYTYICPGLGVPTVAFRWWEIEDGGGFPPFWSFALGTPPPGTVAKPWPANWDRRPHP